MKMKFKLILCVLLCTATASFAQTIKGRLIDSKSKQGIPFGNLLIVNQENQNQPISVNSDTSGAFEFIKVPFGNYSLLITLMGYQKVQNQISINSESPKILDLGNISMLEDLTLLKEITVSGSRPNFTSENGQLKISIANNPFFKSASNLYDVVQKLPGLQLSSDGTLVLANRATPTLFVDGKPVSMNNEEIQIYLRNLSPDMVESVELINQPPSKYDGEYQGIIDVKLKRNLTLGLRGTYNTRLQLNDYTLLDNNLSLTYKADRFAYNLDLVHTIGSTFYNYHALQILANNNAMTTDTRTITANHNYNIQARVIYEIKKGQNIEAFLRTYQINRNAKSANQLLTQTANLTNNIALIHSNNDALPKQNNFASGLNYSRLFKTGELNIITALAQIDNTQAEDIQSRNMLNNIELLDYWKTKSRNQIYIRSIQADYSQNIGVGKLEFGSKFAYTTTQNNLRYDTLANDVFNLDPKRSNEFKYQEYILAGYLSYSAKWKKFNYRLGLRTENTNTIANSITNLNITNRTYLKWLPSLGFTYLINNAEQLSFNYSKRLTRPTFPALNPFRFYYSPRHYWIGNPYLQPSSTNLFALTYSKRALNISINMGRETDPMSRYPEYNPITDELIFLGKNLPYRDFANIQITSPITLNKWWRINNNISLFYNKELTPYYGKTFEIPIYNYTINGSQVFSIKDWLIDLSYNFESKSGNGLYVFSPVYSVDLGVQKAWFKNRINSKLTFYDAFNTVKRRLIFREKAIINNDFYHYFATQRLSFSITYNFGSSTFKAKEAKKSEEENRAN